MQIKLKKQAAIYFESIAEYDIAHKQASDKGTLNKFYVLLIARELDSKGFVEKIMSFSSKKIIDWEKFLQSIWAYALALKQSTSSYKTLANFISQLDRKSLVDRNLILTTLPESLVDAAGIAKKQILDKEARGAYTKFFYDQNKYNLFRQNNEGFAKLSLLLATLNSNSKHQLVEQKIISLIGNYDLDPDRVLDLIIEAFTQSEASGVNFYLIKKFKPESVLAVLGNRIMQQTKVESSQKLVYTGTISNFLTSTPQQMYQEQGFVPNPKLIKLIAMLIKRSVISLQGIFPYLSPADAVLDRLQISRIQYGRQKISKSFKISLEEMNQSDKIKQKVQDQFKLLGQLIYSSKLALIRQLVAQNDWESFKIVWKIYQPKVQLLTYQPLLHVLYEILQWVITPLYNKISLARFFKQKQKKQKSFEQIPQLSFKQLSQCHRFNEQTFKVLDQIFHIISEYIGHNSQLFIKICRLFKKVMKQPLLFFESQISQDYQLAKKNIRKYLYEYLVPGICYQTQNPAISNQAYQLLECFEYQFRYSCYAKVYKQTMVKNPYQAYIFEKIKNKQNIIVNNLSEENKKIFIKKMAKLTHNQCLHVFYWIFRRLMMEDYQAVIPEIVAVLSGSNPLTLQCAVFVVLHCLVQQKQPSMSFKTGQHLPWFKNLITFTSLFFRKYLETDMRPIFDFILSKVAQPIQQLEDNEELPGASLLLLKALLNKMFGSFMVQDINKSKYQIICAGQLMQFEAMYLSSQVKAAKKSKVALQNFFWDSTSTSKGSLAFNILILLTQKRSQFLHRTFIGDFKILGDIYDSFSSTIVQLIRFLHYQAADYSKYSKLLPANSLDLMINQYKLPLQIAFEIYRPSVKNISLMNEKQFDIFSSEIQLILTNYIKSDNKFIEGYEVSQKLKTYLNQNFVKIQKVMSKRFFTTFWFLTLDSIHFPAKLYSDKIEELKKKIQSKMPSKRTSDRDDKQLTKAKSLYEKLTNEEQEQKKKHKETMSQSNLLRFDLEFLHNGSSSEKGGDPPLQQFAEVFVQVCLLPRILLDPSEALYCLKFTIQMIRANSGTSNKNIIRLLTFIIEYVMNYLPFATERQASNCLSVFLSQILRIFINWNDVNKLKQDMSKQLGMNQQLIKDKYPRLKEYLLKLYERVGNLIKTIKDQPYNIKNCLYLLEKIDSIPGYKQQAQEFETHMKQLKQQHTTLDMQTILERQISMLNTKKQSLPEKSEDLSNKRQANPEQVSNSNLKKDRLKSPQKVKPLKNDVIPYGSTNQDKGNIPTAKQKVEQVQLKKTALQKPQVEEKNNDKDIGVAKRKLSQKQYEMKDEGNKKNQQPPHSPLQVQVKLRPQVQKLPLNTVGDRKIELQFGKKQYNQPFQLPQNSQAERIPTVKERRNQIAKRSQDFTSQTKQKDLNEKYSSRKQKNQTLNWNQRGEGQLQQNANKHKKNRQPLQSQIQEEQEYRKTNKDQQRMKGDSQSPKQQNPDQKQKPQQVQPSIKMQGTNPTMESNDNKRPVQKTQPVQKKNNLQIISEKIQIPKQTQKNKEIQKQKLIPQNQQNKNQVVHSSFQEEVNTQNIGKEMKQLKVEAPKQYRAEESQDKRVEWKKGYKPDRFSQKRDNYSNSDKRQFRDYKDRQPKDREYKDYKNSKEREKSNQNEQYSKWKGREDYRQEDRRKNSKDQNHRRQDKYDREKRYDSKNKQHDRDRDRHYRK